ncbi:hypothetical protein BMS3Bbin02_00311 [bacterium BMS3Bbin02]|nr:hypothetical protein BMS3Bbin02_00311 [bacterium BMS3Bbin02]
MLVQRSLTLQHRADRSDCSTAPIRKAASAALRSRERQATKRAGYAGSCATISIGSAPDSPSSSTRGFTFTADSMPLRVSRRQHHAADIDAVGMLHGMDDVDLGICGGQYFAGDPDRVAVLLPGARYVPAAPLLWFARVAAQGQGWSVLQVWDQWDRSVEAEQWVADRLEAALNYVGDDSRVLLITKSITSLALPAAVERGLPGLWLTPLLGRESVRAALKAAEAPTLAVGATADPTWDSEFVSGLLNIEVIEIVAADHSLQHATDVATSINYLRLVTEGIQTFLGRLSEHPT